MNLHQTSCFRISINKFYWLFLNHIYFTQDLRLSCTEVYKICSLFCTAYLDQYLTYTTFHQGTLIRYNYHFPINPGNEKHIAKSFSFIIKKRSHGLYSNPIDISLITFLSCPQITIVFNYQSPNLYFRAMIIQNNYN